MPQGVKIKAILPLGKQMRGKEMSRGHSEPRTHYGKKTLKRCKMKGDPDDFVVIDVDSDSVHNVIIIDVPESLQQKLRGSSVLREDKKIPLRSVISIDDDESTDVNHPGVGVEGRGDLDSDATSSKRSCPASNHSQNSLDSDGDECQFIRERKSSLNFSKSKRIYSGKAPCRNRYGLSPESESGSSDSDCSDCEVMEGSFGKLREQWEKASSKRKDDIRKSGLEDEASPSGSHADAHPDAEVENMCEQHPDDPVCSSSSNTNYEKENLSAFVVTGDGNLGGTSINPEMESPAAHFDSKVDEESFSQWKAESRENVKFSHWKDDVQFGGETFTEDPPFSYGGARFYNEGEKNSQGPSLWSSKEQAEKLFNHARTFQNKEINIPGESCLSDSQPNLNIYFDHSGANVRGKEASSCKSQHRGKTPISHDRGVSKDKDEEFYQAHPSWNSHSPNESGSERSSSTAEEKAVSGEPLFSNSRPSDETQVSSAAPPEDKVGAVPEDASFCNNPLWGKSEVNNEKSVCQEKEKSYSGELSKCNTQHNEIQIKQGRSCLVGVKESVIESMSDSQPQDERNSPFHARDGDATHAVQSDIINEREKLKETEEYKRAVEEEWASRQRQLQIQAEEAQRLRKRKKAESMRLLDMERRQKQRVEEMRHTQKKDEENMNLKEQFRVEIRKELNKLETICSDMASLLRGLGIPVGGGLYPLSRDVHAAYKQALLRFHPDRASGANIRQQVEAEEKFKLISRMKEKLLLTS
ncbi:hypothetical protein L1049_012648 [Liquidambar formosana]|uniref:J domain-containing protein n=1 Tax=Liquidambar formosana TaxID=63359 RepID=A0AAP0R346_LIQFO